MNANPLVKVQSQLPAEEAWVEYDDAAPQPSRAAGVGPLAQVDALLRGRYRIAAVLAVALALVGAIAGYKLPPVKYRSSGIIRIRPNTKRILFQTEQNAVMPMFDSFIESQVALLGSSRVLDYAMQSPDWQALGRGMSQKAIEQFRDSVEVEHPKNTEVIVISFLDRDPSAAAVGSKSLVEAYQKLYGESEADSPARTLQILEDRRTALGNELKSYSDRIHGIAQEFGTDALGPIYDFKLQEVNRLESELQQATLLLASVDGERNGPHKDAASRVTPESVAPFDPEMQSLLHSRLEQQMTLSRLEARYGRNYPSVAEARGELDEINRQIKDRVAEFAQSADGSGATASAGAQPATIAAVRVRKHNLEELWKKGREELLDLGRKNLAIQDLRTQADGVKLKLDATSKRIEELNVEAGASGRFDVFSTGDKPTEPYKDKRLAIAGGAGFGGAVMGFAIVALFGLVERKFRTVADAKIVGGPGLKILGALPILPRRLDDPEQATLAAHCLHQIRTMLQIQRTNPDERVFAITSPSPAAGKTSLTMALGLSFAGARSKTLLIDCDLVGGGLTARTAKAAQVGLLDVLDGAALADCVTAGSVPGLFVLPLGRADAAHAGQLSPERLRGVIDAARAEYEVVLVDTGPLLGSLESLMVSSIADKVLLVLSRGESRPSAVRATHALQAASAKVAGIVFNRATVDDIEYSGYSSSQSMRSQSSRPGGRPRTLPLDDSMQVGPLGTAVAIATAAGE